MTMKKAHVYFVAACYKIGTTPTVALGVNNETEGIKRFYERVF